MRIPGLLYGPYKEVDRRSRRAGRLLARGASLADVTGHDAVSTGEAPGLIVMNGPSPLLGTDPQFHIYLLLLRLEGSLRDVSNRSQIEEQIFRESLQDPWATLGLVSFANQGWLYPSHRHRPFLEAVIRDYSDFASLDGRYSIGSTTGASLWDVPNNIKYVLANLAVETDSLRKSRNADEVVELLMRSIERTEPSQ
jgi:hypothetical protein